MIRLFSQLRFVLPALVIVATIPACGQLNSTAGGGLVRIPVSSKALSGNLIGDPSEREMLVLLPPSYDRSADRRYPVIYYLHGLGKRSSGHLESEGMFRSMRGLMEKGELPEVILVAVDGTTKFGGSYYADSPTIGNYEQYVAVEIVSLVDSLFRTRPERSARAIAGFSMGGHGALKLAMKYSRVFGQVGSLSGSPLSMRYRKSIYKRALAGHGKPTSVAGLLETIRFEENWALAAAYAKAAAFSPNPGKPPLFLDIPFESGRDDERDATWQKWLDDDPLSLVSRYRENLGSLDQIYIDHGDDETTLGTEDIIRELVRYDIGVTHYVFRGDHVDEMFIRHVRMVKFLSVPWY